MEFMSESFKELLTQLTSEEFSSARDYDNLIRELEVAVHREHKRITTDEDGVHYVTVASNMCSDFVVNTYFGGVHPRKDEREFRKLVARLRSHVFTYLRKRYGICGKAPMYKDEVDEMRIRLLDGVGIRTEVDKVMSGPTRKLLEKYQQSA